MQINQVFSVLDKNNVDSIGGRITDIEPKDKPHHVGTNSKGPWTMQKITVQDATGVITVVLWDSPSIPVSRIGSDVLFQAGQSNGKQGGYCGLMADTDSKTNKKIVKATNKAVVQFPYSDQQAPPPQTFAPPPQPAFQPPAAPAPVQQTFTPPPAPMAPQAAPATNGNGTDVRHHLNKSANLYLHAINAGRYVRKTHDRMYPDTPMTDDQFQACVSSLFIQADRALMVSKTDGGEFKG